MKTETYIVDNHTITVEFKKLSDTDYVWTILKDNKFYCESFVPYATEEGMYESARLKVRESFPNATLKNDQ